MIFARARNCHPKCFFRKFSALGQSFTIILQSPLDLQTKISQEENFIKRFMCIKCKLLGANFGQGFGEN